MSVAGAQSGKVGATKLDILLRVANQFYSVRSSEYDSVNVLTADRHCGEQLF